MRNLGYLRIIILIFLFFFTKEALQAQSKGKLYKQYLAGKEQIDAANYSSALPIFEPLLIDSKNNLFVQHAHYFYALAAFRQKQLDKAENTLSNLLTKYPDWNNINDGYYLMAEVKFANNKPEEAISYLEKVQETELKPLAANMAGDYLIKSDLATLRWLHQEKPNNQWIGQALVDKLAVNAQTWEEIEEMESIIAKLNLQSPEKQRIERKVYKKESYNIAVILPIQLSDIKSGDKNTLSQLSVEMYQGIRLAQKHFKEKENMEIKVFTYDIDRGEAQELQNIINSAELEQMDFIIGPLFGNQFSILAKYALDQQINIINPYSNAFEDLYNEFTFLYKPTLKTQSTQAAKEMLKVAKTNNVIIFYDNLEKNKVLAEAHKKALNEQGASVLIYEEINSGNTENIGKFLSSVGKDNIGYIFISTTSQTVAEAYLQKIKALGMDAPTLTLDAWRSTFQDMNITQLEEQKVYFISPNFISPKNRSLEDDYIDLTESSPTDYSYIGYDIFYYFASVLKEYGTKNPFQVFLKNDPAQKGKVVPGFDFQNSNDNQFVPILEYQNGQLELINQIK